MGENLPVQRDYFDNLQTADLYGNISVLLVGGMKNGKHNRDPKLHLFQ